MNITMIYFSQTGNTRRIAEAMAEAFRERGHATRLISLKKASPHNAIMGDLLGIGTPCFSSQAPTPIKTFLKNLPTMEGRRAFVFATSGGAPGRTEVTLGRIVEGQPILPDIDLSPYEAYAHGVSRLHAALKVNPQRVAIMDLGSSNGTRVNGQKIVPHIDYPLKDQDIVALGKLKIQILIQ